MKNQEILNKELIYKEMIKTIGNKKLTIIIMSKKCINDRVCLCKENTASGIKIALDNVPGRQGRVSHT